MRPSASNHPDPRSLELERSVGELLRALPPRTAPASLQARVLAQIGRRAALPWWRRSVRQWPALPRTAFVVVCVLLVGLTAVAGSAAVHWPLPSPSLLALLRAARDLSGTLARALPLSWLYALLGLLGLLYALVFALSATAYRWLYLREGT